MQYLGINSRSSPNDQYFNSKVPDANTTRGLVVSGIQHINKKCECEFNKIVAKIALIP